MGKHDFLTPKAIGIRMKAKGLQKLRWFCQVCQKQCRDENGFKCHTTSEAHQRQMLIVANNPNKFIGGYSELFEEAFLENLRRRHGTKRMRATYVYNEYIADKMHVHMNATQWNTLSGFVQYLGRTGKCVVDETEKGWHIQYIDRDPKAIARQEELEKKKKAELDHEERNRLFIERQLKIASEKEGETQQRPTKLQRGEDGEKITMALGVKKETKKESKKVNVAAFGATGLGMLAKEGRENRSESKQSNKRHAVDAIMEEEERRRKEKDRLLEEESDRQRKENWVTTGIVVKVTNKKVGDGQYYKCKGVVKDVEDKFCARVELLDSGDVLRLDQDDLETVIPKPGRKVKIVNGLGRGCVAKLLDISVNDFCARIRIDSGSHRGEILDRVEYEDICRLADELNAKTCKLKLPVHPKKDKDGHPHRLERDKRFEAEKNRAHQSPRRGGPQAHQLLTTGPLSSRQRGVHGDKTITTPRRQMQRPREGMQEDRRRDDWDTTHSNRENKQNLQPQYLDEQSAQGHSNEEELMQLMEGCQIGGTVANGEVVAFVQQQNQVQKSTKESEARLPGGLIGGNSRPSTGLKTSLSVENQGDIGTFLVSQQTSRSRRPSIHRATQSPRTDVSSFEESNNFTREWSTTPTPFASLHPQNLVGHAASVCALVAHDNRFIVSCSVDGSVKVWSQVTFECLHTIYGHRDVVSCVDLNMRWLVSGSHDNTLRLYDSVSSSFTLLHVLTGHTGHVTHVRLTSSLPNYIISGSDDYTLRLWNAELGQFIYELSAHHSRVTCFDVQLDHICSGAADGSVCFWDISSLSLSPEHPSDHHLPCTRIYYAHKATVQCIVGMSSSRATSTNTSELSSVVITGSNDNTIQLFSARTFAHLGRLDNVGSPVYAAAPLTNDRLLCSTKDGRLLLYGNMFRPTTRKTPAVLQLGSKWISSLHVCGDLVACSSEEVLYIVDTSRMCMALVFETQHSFITCTRWIHKGALLTAGQDNVIKLWAIA